jgi:cell wall assembly regulator SMI1
MDIDMRNLNWFEIGSGADKFTIEELENEIGFSLPVDYLQFAAKYSGSSNPAESEFDVRYPGGFIHIGNFGVLLQLIDSNSESILGTIKNLGDQIPYGIVPIITTGHGDHVCLDYRTQGKVSIAYRFHGQTDPDAFVTLANSFSDFLDMLREPCDEM